MNAAINFYSSDKPDGLFFTLVRQTGENLGKVVALHPLSEMPAPDTQRPTRQQLRKELVEVQQALKECKTHIALAEPHADLLMLELKELRTQRDTYEVRINQICFTLGIVKEGAPQS